MTAAGSVTLDVWSVEPRQVPLALVQSRLAVRRLRADPQVSFAKVLGTAGARFSPSDARPTRWCAVVVWRRPVPGPHAATQWWRRHARETATLQLRTVWSRGRWDGREPFPDDDARPSAEAPVLALTRSTVRLRRARRFYAAVPPVADEVRDATGLRVAFGIGEAPVLRQGTVSLWRSSHDLTSFAHGADAHRAAMRRTPEVGWYAEELFARFAVVDARGSIDGVDVAA